MDNDSENLEASLQEMAEAGVMDGSGSFTLASERAQAMMERFLLEEPRAYVLNLVASGVAGGASGVDIYTDADDCIVKFDGQLPTSEELQNLVSYALMDGGEPRLRELAMGVLGARALKPRWVRVSVSDGKVLRTLTLGSEERFEEEETQTKAGVKIHLKEALSLKALWRALIRPEATIVGHRCRFSPVPILLNGMAVNRMVESRAVLASAVLSPTGDTLAEGWSWRSRLPVQRVVTEDLRGALFVYRGAGNKPSSLGLVLNGVLFECEESLGWEGVGAVIYCSDLQKDLSQNQIVRDQGYLQTVVSVQKRLTNLVDHLLDNWSELVGNDRHARADLLDAAARQARSESNWRRATYILTKIVSIQEALRGPTDTEAQRCRLSLADCLLEAEQVSEGLGLLLKESRVAEEMGRRKLRRELLVQLDSLLTAHPDADQSARLEVLEGLAVCEARRGRTQECTQFLERLKAEYQAQKVEDAEQRLERVELECQVIDAKSSENSAAVCHRCGSGHLMRDCRVLGRKGASIDVMVGQRNPDAVLFTDPIFLPVQATVCGDCGHVEFTVKNPQKAWTEYLSISGPKT